MNAVSINNAMRDLPNLIKRTIADSEETLIVTDNGSVVIIDKDKWDGIQETLRILKDKQSLKALLQSHKMRDQGKKIKSKSVSEAFYDLQE